ncbi:hypothetical protein FHT21_004618 [Pedobacter sp. SG908]|nr:hypothetical protein [Pedobacter sp. SG908]NMN39592.1 hypothetical protein [Pedobacter sp. SG918]
MQAKFQKIQQYYWAMILYSQNAGGGPTIFYTVVMRVMSTLT